MNLTKIHPKTDLFVRTLKKTLWDTAGIFLLKSWERIEKENVGTVEDTMLPEIIRIQAEGFENEKPEEMIKYSNKFRNVFYVIKNQDKVIGYCTYRLKPAYSSRGFEKKSVIYSIAIDSKFKNQGFGRKLLEESIMEMKLNRVSSVFLFVNVNNAPALKLYKKTGFSIVKEVKNICGQNERCYKMELKLF